MSKKYSLQLLLQLEWRILFTESRNLYAKSNTSCLNNALLIENRNLWDAFYDDKCTVNAIMHYEIVTTSQLALAVNKIIWSRLPRILLSVSFFPVKSHQQASTV